MHHNSHNASVTGILVLGWLILAACGTQSITPSTSQGLLATPAQTDAPYQACALATLAALQTQEKIGADVQAAATAEIMRANAQATLNSASSTLSAAQTQQQNNANIVAAQIAATAAIVRANAQATLDSAGATQNAALTQDAIRQTQMADVSTSNAQALLVQQNQANLAAGTQTAIFPIPSPRRPKPPPRHHNGISTRNASVMNSSGDRLPFSGRGVFRSSFYWWRV
jgi:hypothetical protein